MSESSSEPRPLTDAEEAFAEFKSLVRIHLKQMLTLDRKPPIFTVALLVTVACEQVSRLFPSEGTDEAVFSKALIEPHNISSTIGRALFDVIRNGLAHSYLPKMLQIEDEVVGTTLAWKSPNGHLRVGGIRHVEGRHAQGVPIEQDETGHRWLVIVVESLWQDLDAYLIALEERLRSGALVLNLAAAARQVKPIQGSAAIEWQTFLDRQTVTSKSSREEA
jgi:hypothetical protein